MTVYRDAGGVPSSAAPAAPPVSVCRRCGVVAPARGRTCAVCGSALAETRVEVPALPQEALWVAVRCAFTCNQCKFLAPLDALDADGAVDCASCGLHQRFDVEAWREVLDFAHAVGDLAGPSPEGRHPHPTLWIGSENPYASVGDDHAFGRRDEISASGVAVDAAPGHPVCHACHVPLATQMTGSGAVATQCPRCGERAEYTIPDDARRLSGSLLGAIAHEHRTDRPRARAAPTKEGVIALACPSCGAPLSVSGTGRLQTCSFCKASCIVPARSVSQQGQDAPPSEVWWLLFQGASKKRRELEAPTVEVGSAVKAAIDLLKPGADTAPIGDAPGVYAAPEVKGIYWPQVGLTLLLGSAAVAIGFGIFELFR
jgi:hypothetical protein